MRAFHVLTLLLLATVARADVLFSTFGPGDSYGPNGLVLIQSFQPHDPVESATATFTVPDTPLGNAAWQLETVERVLTNDSPLPLLNAGINTDPFFSSPYGENFVQVRPGGVAYPGDSLVLFSVFPLFDFCTLGGDNCQGTGQALWNYNSQGMTGPTSEMLCESSSGCQTTRVEGLLPAFRVFASPIPEPSALLLLATACLALIGIARRFKIPSNGMPGTGSA